jgi:hypothetical protein
MRDYLNYKIPVLKIVLVVFPGGQRLRGGIGDVWGWLWSFSEGHRRQGQEQAAVRIGLEAVHTSHDLPTPTDEPRVPDVQFALEPSQT